MPSIDFDLEHLLRPIEPEAFFRDRWEKEPLHLSRGQSGYYAGLFSLADVDDVIAFSRPRFAEPGSLQTAPRASSYVQGELPDRHSVPSASYPGIAELRRVFHEGKTVVLRAMQQRWPAVAILCRCLEGQFHCPVHANLYLTPPGAQGFDAHFDTHEVFVLQLEGFKHWRLYDRARSLPLADDPVAVSRDQLGDPHEIRLEAGDLLYIPRGHVHEAFTSTCVSLHLTLGINLYRWIDLLHHTLSDLARKDERFRASLPAGALIGSELPSDVKERFQELLHLLAGTSAGDACRRLGDHFFGQLQPLPNASFVPADESVRLDLDTVLEKSPGAICRVIREGNWVAIEFPGNRVGGPLKVASALHFIAGSTRFPIRALPDDLSGDAKLVLARRLVREGLLRVGSPLHAASGATAVETCLSVDPAAKARLSRSDQ